MEPVDAAERGTAEPLLPTSQPVEHWTRRTCRTVYAGAQQFAFSGLFGLVTAVALKTISTAIAIAVVLLFIAMQVMAYYGFVSLNWRSVGGSIARRMDLDGDGRVDMKDVRTACSRVVGWALSWGALSSFGYGCGFVAGLKLA